MRKLDYTGAAPIKICAIAWGAALAAGCLPGDTRPVPERVDATVEPGPGLTYGIETADGWTIAFDRFLLAAGNFDFEEDDGTCNSYAEARYDRLFDFAAVKGRQKLGTAYGLGTCRTEFRLRAPSFDAILGPGTTADDVAMMRAEATDRFADDERMSVLAIGKATRGNESKRFEWVFRQSYEITDCKALDGEGFVTTLTLTEGASSGLPIEVRPEELFRAKADDGAEFLFQPMADADADGDGAVTFDELSKAPRPVVEDPDGGAGGSPDAGSPGASLEGMVYKELLPRVLRISGGGSCEVDERGGGR